MAIRAVVVAVGLAGVLAGSVRAQDAGELVERGRHAPAADPARALRFFEAALAVDPMSYEASWRAAVAAVELGEQLDGSASRARRDSLFQAAIVHARRAVALDSGDVNGQFALAMALGRLATLRGGRDRLQYAAEIHAVATRAETLDPGHDGVHHILGLWHAEAMRTSGIGRFMARNILGAKFLGQASWEQAVGHLERAVALDPGRLYHRLDLARVYVDRKRYLDARAQLDTLEVLPDRVPLDPRYRDEARAVRLGIRDKVSRAERDRAPQ